MAKKAVAKKTVAKKPTVEWWADTNLADERVRDNFVSVYGLVKAKEFAEQQRKRKALAITPLGQ